MAPGRRNQMDDYGMGDRDTLHRNIDNKFVLGGHDTIERLSIKWAIMPCCTVQENQTYI